MEKYNEIYDNIIVTMQSPNLHYNSHKAHWGIHPVSKRLNMSKFVNFLLHHVFYKIWTHVGCFYCKKLLTVVICYYFSHASRYCQNEYVQLFV